MFYTSCFFVVFFYLSNIPNILILNMKCCVAEGKIKPDIFFLFLFCWIMNMKAALFFALHKLPPALLEETAAFSVKHCHSFHVIYVSSVLFLVRDDT